MSYISSHLQPGEQVLIRTNRGRKWYHFLWMVFGYFIFLPIMAWIMLYFLVQIFGEFLSQTAALIFTGVFLIVLALGGLVDIIHFLVDDIALTDRRILGLAQGATTWSFKKYDIPLSVIESIRATGGALVGYSLEIQRRDVKHKLYLRNLVGSKQLAAKITELINRHY